MNSSHTVFVLTLLLTAFGSGWVLFSNAQHIIARFLAFAMMMLAVSVVIPDAQLAGILVVLCLGARLIAQFCVYIALGLRNIKAQIHHLRPTVFEFNAPAPKPPLPQVVAHGDD